jgi:DNA-binding NarL/FixJ family response regulator
MPDLRILVIADDPLARAGLATLLAEQPGCAVTGRVSSLDDLAAAIEVYRPDLLLWDLGWNPASALDRLANLRTHLPVAVLLPDDAHAAQVWAAGTRGLLRRDADPTQLSVALTAVAQGLAVVDPAFVAALLPAHGDETSRSETIGAFGGADRSALAEPLTPREIEVLRLLAEGLPNKAIARRLRVSEHTVKFHVNAILGKLGVASRTEAVVRATRLGLILL